jgi:hypothetical protein
MIGCRRAKSFPIKVKFGHGHFLSLKTPSLPEIPWHWLHRFSLSGRDPLSNWGLPLIIDISSKVYYAKMLILIFPLKGTTYE